MLSRPHRQEGLSRAYIQAIAARCGMICSFRDQDYGIDGTLHHVKQRQKRAVESGTCLDVQAKSSSRVTFRDQQVLYDMEVKTYDDLRDSDIDTPRILVLLALPEKEAEWLEWSEQQLVLRRCAYWHNLRGYPPTKNTDQIRISIPRAQVFTVQSLEEIIARVRRGEQP